MSKSAGRAPLLTLLRKKGLSKGLAGSNAWLVLGLSAGVVQLLKRMAAKAPEVVLTEKLDPGQGLLITHLRAGGE